MFGFLLHARSSQPIRRSLAVLALFGGAAACTLSQPAASPAVEAQPPKPLAMSEAGQAIGSVAPPSPSTGCAKKTGGPEGEGTIAAGGQETPYLVTLPQGYDPSKPAALVFAFHGRTRSHLSMHAGDASQLHEQVGSQSIVAYLKSVGTGWSASSVAPFEALYDRMLSNYCVDTERVFAVGHSSGAHFAHRLACAHSEKLRGIAAVAGGIEQPVCGGRTAAILIHGQRDAVVSISRGRRALQHVLERNRCEETTEPLGSEECRQYSSCDDGLDVVWCEHDEPTYENTNHGWPSFASSAIATFFDSLQRTPLPTGRNLLATPLTRQTWDATFATPQLGHVQQQPGELCAEVVQAGQNPWDAQLADHDLTLQAGQRYRIDVKLRASAPTDVRLKVGQQTPPYGEVWVQTRQLGTESLRIIDEFDLVEKPAKGAMAFALQTAGPLVKTLPVSVCIQHAWLSPVGD